MTDERIIAYLLEELSEEEAERFEEECFAAEDWPDQLTLAEEDLIEDYLREELTPERRKRFEQSYLTTAARLERVRMAAALLRHTDEQRAGAEAVEENVGGVSAKKETPTNWFRNFWSGESWAPRAALALAVLAIIVGGWWLLRPRTPTPQTVAMLTLSVARSDRADGAPVAGVKLPPDARALKVTLLLPEGESSAERYRVELEEAGGERRTLEVTEQDARSVSLEIPSSQLARKQYALRLFAAPTNGPTRRIGGSYFFKVE